MPWLVLLILRTDVSRKLLIHSHKIELRKFGVRVLLKRYWKQDHKLVAAVRRMYAMEGVGVVSERVAQR